MSQIALAWQWMKGISSPIIGATKTVYLDDAVGALDVKLTDLDKEYFGGNVCSTSDCGCN